MQGKEHRGTPPEINAREEVGRWEMDTVESAKDGSLERVLALTDRVTRNQINLRNHRFNYRTKREVIKQEKRGGARNETGKFQRHGIQPPEK